MKTLVAASVLALSVPVAAVAGGPREMTAQASEAVSRFQTTGDFRTCLPLKQVDHLDIIDPQLILVRSNNQYYYNQTQTRCDSRGDNYRLQYRTSASQLCSGQIIDVVDNFSGILLGACSLGRFERVVEKASEG